MPGTNAGTGQPISFHCAAARRVGWREPRRYEGHRVTLTGKSRVNYGNLGQRSTDRFREYRCECGHVGWSNHVDLARMAGESPRLGRR